MKRAFILLLDSFGVGASDDADQFGDVGANTFGHIARDYPGLHIPNLTRLGLVAAAEESCGEKINCPVAEIITGKYGYAAEKSLGKDTPSGHWEIAGVPVLFKWGYFPPEYPSFPEKLINEFIKRCNLPGVLGNKHGSGTEILKELGEEHIKTGKPIVYTSADSVFQIAAHEEHFGLERLYELCDVARELVDEYHIGRVIARPFVGENGEFTRTGNRKDLATSPPEPTLLPQLIEQGGKVHAIGKVADIYAHQGISELIKATGNDNLFSETLNVTQRAKDKSLVFTNFVDFDSSYGHRRDVAGYAKALEHFDRRLPEFEALMQPGDIAIIAADHGCDPTWPGSDHTREHIPVLMFGPDVEPGSIGKRETFADIGQTIAMHLEIEPLKVGTAFL